MAELLKYEQTEISYRGRPAVTDISFTLREGEILGIVLTDHIIIGDLSYCSLKEMGLLSDETTKP